MLSEIRERVFDVHLSTVLVLVRFIAEVIGFTGDLGVKGECGITQSGTTREESLCESSPGESRVARDTSRGHPAAARTRSLATILCAWVRPALAAVPDSRWFAGHDSALKSLHGVWDALCMLPPRLRDSRPFATAATRSRPRLPGTTRPRFALHGAQRSHCGTLHV
jgi:hypothetical protein